MNRSGTMMIAKKAVEDGMPAEKKRATGNMLPPERPVPLQKQLTILLVDDHRNTLKIMGMVVSGLGYNVKTASDGAEALGLFKEGGIDLVITDYKMPGMNGLELLKELKRHDQRVQVVIATAYGKLLDMEMLEKAGAMAVLNKPLDRKDIEKVIDAAGKTNKMVKT